MTLPRPRIAPPQRPRFHRLACVAVGLLTAGCGAFAGSASPGPEAAERREQSDRAPTTERLSNGLRIDRADIDGAAVTTLQLWIPCGRGHEPHDLAGAAALAARALQSRATPGIEALGGRVRAWTGPAVTVLEVEAARERAEDALDVVGAALSTPGDPKALNALRPEVAAEARAARGDTSRAAVRAALALSFGDHPATREAAGPGEGIERLDAAAVVDFAGQCHRPDDAWLLVRGDVADLPADQLARWSAVGAAPGVDPASEPTGPGHRVEGAESPVTLTLRVGRDTPEVAAHADLLAAIAAGRARLLSRAAQHDARVGALTAPVAGEVAIVVNLGAGEVAATLAVELLEWLRGGPITAGEVARARDRLRDGLGADAGDTLRRRGAAALRWGAPAALDAWREAVERARPEALAVRLEEWMVPTRLSVVGPSATETADAAGAALGTPVPASGSVSVSTPAPAARLVVRHESGPRVAVRVVFEDARRTEPPTRPGVAALAGYSLASRLSARASVDAAARLARLARTLRAPRPRAEDLEAARTTLRRALVAPAPEPAAERALASALFGDHPYARDPSGALGALSELTVTDVRAELAHRLAPGPLTIVVVGPVAPALAERLFRDALHDRTTLGALPEAGAPLVARQGRVQETVRSRRGAVWWAWPLDPTGGDIQAATVLAEVVARSLPEVRARVLRGRVGGALVLAARGTGEHARGRLAAAVERLRSGVGPEDTRTVLARLAGRAALEGGDPAGRAHLLARAAVADGDLAALRAAVDRPAARWTSLNPEGVAAAATRLLTVPPPVDLELQPTAEVSQREPARR